MLDWDVCFVNAAFCVAAVVLAKVEAKEFDAAVLQGWMDQALTGEDDWALFELPEISG